MFERNQERPQDAKVMQWFLELLNNALQDGATGIHFEPRDLEVEILFFQDASEDAQGTKRSQLKIITTKLAVFQHFAHRLNERLWCWPEPNDAQAVLCMPEPRRFLCSIPGENSIIMDVQGLPWKPNAIFPITCTNIRQNPESVFYNLGTSTEVSGPLLRMVNLGRGLFLTNQTKQPHGMDGLAMISALCPRASLYRGMPPQSRLAALLAAASEAPVIISIEGCDPVQLLSEFLGQMKSLPEARNQIVTQLAGIFIHERVRRVCPACSRSTPTDQRMTERVPRKLQGLVDKTYMFGRGCDQCGHSCYHGTVSADSVVVVDDEVRAALSAGKAETFITPLVYQAGTRPLMEDGLKKIAQGLTSFEEVFAVAPTVSATFADVIAFVAPKPMAMAPTSPSDGTLRPVAVAELSIADLVRQQRGEAPLASAGPAPAAASSQQPAPPPRSAGPARLLVVEDDNDQREVLELVFRSAGYEVFGATNGQIAFDMLQTKAVDLVVADFMMPVMGGEDLVKRIRATPMLAKLPVLILTAAADADIEERMLGEGADDYCAKNVKKKVLLKRVERLVQRFGQGGGNPVGHLLQE